VTRGERDRVFAAAIEEGVDGDEKSTVEVSRKDAAAMRPARSARASGHGALTASALIF
jgi:hypothetical protein